MEVGGGGGRGCCLHHVVQAAESEARGAPLSDFRDVFGGFLESEGGNRATPSAPPLPLPLLLFLLLPLCKCVAFVMFLRVWTFFFLRDDLLVLIFAEKPTHSTAESNVHDEATSSW